MRVSDVMTRRVVTLLPDMTLEQAAERLVQEGVSGAPVVDGRGRLLGVLSESDLLRHLRRIADETLGKRYLTEEVHSLALLGFLGEREHAAVNEVYKKLRASRVSDAMTKKVFSVPPDVTLEACASIMVLHDVNRVPVVADNLVIGIVSRADLARVLAEGRGSAPRL